MTKKFLPHEIVEYEKMLTSYISEILNIDMDDMIDFVSQTKFKVTISLTTKGIFIYRFSKHEFVNDELVFPSEEIMIKMDKSITVPFTGKPKTDKLRVLNAVSELISI